MSPATTTIEGRSADEPEEGPARARARRLVVLYASQTGNAESIAQHIASEGRARGFTTSEATVLDSLVEKPGTISSLLSDAAYVIVTSTTGDGDPPDNATKFWRWLRRAKKVELDDIFKGKKYTVLGLGDTNYTNFCQMAKRMDRKMIELGCESFYPRGLADDGTGLEQVVDPWIAGLWPALEKCVEFDDEAAEAFSKKEQEKNLSDLTAIEKKLEAINISGDAGDTLADLYCDVELHHRPMPIRLPFSMAELPPLEQLETAAAPSPPKSSFTLVRTETKRAMSDTSIFEVLSSSKKEFSADHPCKAPVIESKLLTGPKALKRVVEITLDISEVSEHWRDFQPGDAIGVIAPNPPQVVDLLIRRLNISDDSDTVHDCQTTSNALANFKSSTPREILSLMVDLRAPPRKPVLRFLADHASDAGERTALLALSGATFFKALKAQHPATTTILDLLATFKSISTVPLADLVELLPRLQPRWYSIAKKTATTVSIAFNITEYEVSGRKIIGHCTPWLETRKTGDVIPVFPKPPSSFRLTLAASSPAICIAAGTGITPFLPFLERRASEVSAPTWVIYGRRFAGDDDFIYGDDLCRLMEAGGISRLVECLSREETSEFKYVQDAVQGHAREIWNFVTEGGAVFICGGVEMAKGVHKALLDVAVSHGGMSADDAKAYWNSTMREGRYLKDIWG